MFYQVVFQVFKNSRYFTYVERCGDYDEACCIAKRLKKKSPSLFVFVYVRTISLSDGLLIPII